MTSCQITFSSPPKRLFCEIHDLFLAIDCVHIQSYRQKSAKLEPFIEIGCVKISLLRRKSVKLAPFFNDWLYKCAIFV